MNGHSNRSSTGEEREGPGVSADRRRVLKGALVLGAVPVADRKSANPTTAAAQAGTGAGQNLAGVGVIVNLAPVLDVFDKSGTFIDEYQRSYSKNAATVTSCGQAFISAQQKTGVAATAKTFPRSGLGGE